MTAPKKLNGLVFGRLTVLNLNANAKPRSWDCKCSCGNTKVVVQKYLTNGDTKSCGCIKKEQIAKRNRQGKIDHSKLSTGEKEAHNKWKSMRIRVKYPTGKSECYKGISICKRWESFDNFLADMGFPPEGYSLDRIDSSKNYSPDNCRWVPLSEQAKNTKRNRIIVFKNKLATISDHARNQGLEPDVVFDRINKLGWDLERALITPARKIKKERTSGRDG